MTLPSRPSEKSILVPEALCTLDDAMAYLKRSTNDQVEVVRGLINEATAVIEMYCRRRLASRIYDGTTIPALWLDGTGRSDALAPEWPITAVSGVRYKAGDTAGTLTTMDASQWFEQPNGILHLPFSGGFPKGIRNIEIKATCGYTLADHARERNALKLAMKRLIQINWSDRDQGVGRGTGFSVGGQSIQLIDQAIPKDVARILAPFERLL